MYMHKLSYILRDIKFLSVPDIAGNFGEMQSFAFFEGRAVNSHTPVFTCKALGGCGFLALNREYYNHQNFPLYDIKNCAL